VHDLMQDRLDEVRRLDLAAQFGGGKVRPVRMQSRIKCCHRSPQPLVPALGSGFAGPSTGMGGVWGRVRHHAVP
jgi:hypothetical protein